MAQPPDVRAAESDRERAAADLRELLDVASEAAHAAGSLLRARFEAGREARVASKTTPTDPVSEADLASQHAIRSLLERRRPRDGFLAEEEGADLAGTSGLRWVVDPLDGTVNYLYGIPQWCVSVAVCDADGTLAGVVHAPMSGETFTAVRGELPRRDGVELARLGEAAPVLGQALVATGFAYDSAVRAQQADVLERLLPRVRDIRRAGSAALDLAWTAMGRYDAYFERDRDIWDVAAGALICECAGLTVRTLGATILAAPDSLVDSLAQIIVG